MAEISTIHPKLHGMGDRTSLIIGIGIGVVVGICILQLVKGIKHLVMVRSRNRRDKPNRVYQKLDPETRDLTTNHYQRLTKSSTDNLIGGETLLSALERENFPLASRWSSGTVSSSRISTITHRPTSVDSNDITHDSFFGNPNDSLAAEFKDRVDDYDICLDMTRRFHDETTDQPYYPDMKFRINALSNITPQALHFPCHPKSTQCINQDVSNATYLDLINDDNGFNHPVESSKNKKMMEKLQFCNKRNLYSEPYHFP